VVDVKPSVLLRCWLGDKDGIQPVKTLISSYLNSFFFRDSLQTGVTPENVVDRFVLICVVAGSQSGSCSAVRRCHVQEKHQASY